MMKAFFKNKRGFALPTVLGTFVLITGIAAGLFIMVSNMTVLVGRDIEINEDNFEILNNVQVARNIIRDDVSILDEENSSRLTALANRLSVSIDLIEGKEDTDDGSEIWRITGGQGTQLTTLFLKRTFTTSSGGSTTIDDDFFEDNEVPEEVSMTFMQPYLTEYFDHYNFESSVDQSFETMDDVMDFVISSGEFSELQQQNNQTVETHWFIDGDSGVVQSDGRRITVADGFTLFINGDLVIENQSGFDLLGNFVINGDLIFNSSGGNPEYLLIGTFYVSGNVIYNGDHGSLILGSNDRPTFIFSQNTIDIRGNGLKNQTHYAFLFADHYLYQPNHNRSIRGFLRANSINNQSETSFITQANGNVIWDQATNLTWLPDSISNYSNKFFDWAIPSSIGDGSGGIVDATDPLFN